MTRREAALILGVRERAKEEAIKDAHRKIMIANHPDAGNIYFFKSVNSILSFAVCHTEGNQKLICIRHSKSLLVTGGSSYLATKINEAKTILLDQKGRTSAF